MTIRVARAGHILELRLGESGRRNVMNEAWFDTLEEHLHDAQNDGDVRVVLLYSEADGFCAGGDLDAFREGPLPDGYLRSRFARLVARLVDFDKPIVAAVHGYAIGGGSTLLLHCDFVYAAQGTTFQMPFVRLGLVPEFGSSYLAPLYAGIRRATEMVLLGRSFDADLALRAGIVTAITPAQDVLATARETAQALAEMPPRSMRESKRLLKAGHRAAIETALVMEGKALEAGYESPELQEAIAAFFEKRPADFSNFK